MDDKKTIRKNVLSIRNSLLEVDRKVAENELFSNLPHHSKWINADIILSFASYGSEIDTYRLNNLALSLGKKLFLPKTEADGISFYRVDSYEELTSGYKGIMEPTGESECFDYEKSVGYKCLIILPGACFDNCGNRFGYGGGFYDRFLADKPFLCENSIAIGYKCQMYGGVLPVEPTDVRISEILLF